MKRTYITPSMEVVNMEATTILATSTLSIMETEVDTSLNGQLGREDRPSTPNLWDQQW